MKFNYFVVLCGLLAAVACGVNGNALPPKGEAEPKTASNAVPAFQTDSDKGAPAVSESTPLANDGDPTLPSSSPITTTTVAPNPDPKPTPPPTTSTTASTSTSGTTSTTPATSTTSTPATPTSPTPSTSTIPPTSPAPAPSPTPNPTPKPTPHPDPTTPQPSPTPAPEPKTTTLAPSPPPPCKRFDAPSFIGGIVLTLGLLVIAFIAYKFYKARNELHYQTL